jgi:sugar phosphate isomerase/epimerase
MFTLSLFADEAISALDRFLVAARDLGLDHVELESAKGQWLCTLRKGQLCALKKRLDAHGLRVAVLYSPTGDARVDEEFDRQLAEFGKVQEAAEILGARHIRVRSFRADACGNLLNRADDVLERMEALTREAARRDQVLLLENGPRTFAATPARCRAVLDRINSRHLRAFFNPVAWLEAGMRPFDVAWPVLQEYVGGMQLRDAQAVPGHSFRCVPPGEGDGQIEKLLAALAGRRQPVILSVAPCALPPRMREGSNRACPCEVAVRAARGLLAQLLERRQPVSPPAR